MPARKIPARVDPVEDEAADKVLRPLRFTGDTITKKKTCYVLPLSPDLDEWRLAV
jgi:hypothetical protein